MHNRDHKQFGLGSIHHVYNRGVGKMDIFLNPADWKSFVFLLNENLFPEMVPISRRVPSPGGYLRKLLPTGAFTLLGYCLMPNHFHLIIRQNTNLPISKLMLKVCGSYSKQFNKKYNRVGSVFQDQFKTVLVESDAQLLWLSAYVHNNPKTGGLVENLKDFPFSSYLDYVGLRNGKLVDKSLILSMVKNDPILYRQFVEESYIKIKERKDLDDLFLD